MDHPKYSGIVFSVDYPEVIFDIIIYIYYLCISVIRQYQIYSTLLSIYMANLLKFTRKSDASNRT